MDDGRKTDLQVAQPRRYRARRALGARRTTAPAAAAANSLNALIDGHRLSGDRRFLEKAEQLVRRVRPPRRRHRRHGACDVPEQRWFYTMFLQSLGQVPALQGGTGRARRDVRVRPRQPAALRALDGRRTSIRTSRSPRSWSFRPRRGRPRTSARATSSTSLPSMRQEPSAIGSSSAHASSTATRWRRSRACRRERSPDRSSCC